MTDSGKFLYPISALYADLFHKSRGGRPGQDMFRGVEERQCGPEDDRRFDVVSTSGLHGTVKSTPRTAAFEYQLLFPARGVVIPKVTRHILAIVSVDFGGDGDSPSGTGLWLFDPVNPTIGANSTRFKAGFFILPVVLVVQLQISHLRARHITSFNTQGTPLHISSPYQPSLQESTVQAC